MNSRNPQKQSGFSLIEVMLSAFIVSTSLLGVLSLQMFGLKGTHHSYMKQQAMSIAQNAMERMAANRPGVIDGYYELNSENYDCTVTRPDCSGTTSCDSEKVALLDTLNMVCGYQADSTSVRTGTIKAENATDITALSTGSLSISCRPDCTLGDVTVAVGWTERALGKEDVVRDSLSLSLRVAAP